MKPDWNDAPEWARYMAQDSDGSWFWYENEPIAQKSYFLSNGNLQPCRKENPNWRSTVEERPVPNPEPEVVEDIEF